MITGDIVLFVVEVDLSWLTIKAAMIITVKNCVYKLKIFVVRVIVIVGLFFIGIIECINDYVQYFDWSDYFEWHWK